MTRVGLVVSHCELVLLLLTLMLDSQTIHNLKIQQHCLCLEGDAVEVSVWILDLELLDSLPSRGGKGDMLAPTFQHPSVENTYHMTLTIEDKRT